MRTIYAALVCAIAVLASRPAQSQGDELDDLLSSPPAAASEAAPLLEPASSELSFDAADHVELTSNEASYTDQSRWHPNVGISVPPAHKSKSHESATHESAGNKSGPTVDLNLVPEPSAWLLAGVALVYFLVFGRRRNVL